MRLQSGVYIDDTTTAYRLNQSIPASFTVWKDDNVSPTLYRAESNLEGVDDISGTSAVTVIEAAMTALPTRTWKEKVMLKGNFTVTDTIDIPAYTCLEIQGKLTLGNGVNKDILKISGSNYYIDVIGGILDGNKANNTAGNGLFIADCGYSNFENLQIKNCKQDGINFESSQRCDFNNIRITDCDVNGIHFNMVGGETTLSNIYVYTCGAYGMLFESVAYVNGVNLYSVSNVLSGIKFIQTGAYACCFNCLDNVHAINNLADGIALKDTIDIQLSNVVAYDDQETPTQDYGIGLDSAYGTVISGVFRKNTLSGILMHNSTWTTLCKCLSEYNAEGGIVETGTSDYNTVVSCVTKNNTVAGITMIGANSKVASSWNNGVWVV